MVKRGNLLINHSIHFLSFSLTCGCLSSYMEDVNNDSEIFLLQTERVRMAFHFLPSFIYSSI